MQKTLIFISPLLLSVLSLAGCKEAEAPSTDGSEAVAEALENSPLAVDSEPLEPLGYDQSVRCLFLAGSAVRSSDTSHGLSIEQLGAMQARARESAYEAAPREERQATVDEDLRQLLREAAIASPQARGSGVNAEHNARLDRQHDARRIARNEELNGVCARFIR